MNIYKVTFKEEKGESYWDMKPLLIVAANYSSAEDKAYNFHATKEIKSIVVLGETTRKTDVYEITER